MNQNDKRSQVCEMYFLPISDALVNNTPGMEIIKIRGEWTRIGISSGEFKEKQDTVGGIVEQELKATVTDTGETNTEFVRKLIANEGLVLIDMTNGGRKVIGTDQFPVLLSSEYSGSPLKLSLSLKRDSPEQAKVFKSF